MSKVDINCKGIIVYNKGVELDKRTTLVKNTISNINIDINIAYQTCKYINSNININHE